MPSAARRGSEGWSSALAWLLEHCPHSVIDHHDPAARFVLAFRDPGEAEAFRSRCLD
jgi:hypothetical protein